MNESPSIVYVVDDNAAMRRALRSLIRSVGLEAEPFASPREFLDAKRPEAPSCLILDVRLPGTSGLDFQRELTRSGISIPIIFISAHADVPMSVQAMKAGAVEFLTKPFRDQAILDAIHVALKQDRARRQRESEVAALQQRLGLLTPREREVLPLVVSGLPNKQIASKIGISEAAVKVHRSQVIRKMGAGSLAELVRMAEKLGISFKAI
jgi:RNA polymerase sigma factor (sigma-70 family)